MLLKLNNHFTWIKNRYLLAILFTLIWMLFLDRYDWISQTKFYLEIRSMQKDKEFYIKEIERLKAEKVTITQNIHAVEKFAREAYFMKRPDEDLFILTDQ